MQNQENKENQEIAKYVSLERARGVREEDIKTELLAKGWKEEDVQASMEASTNTPHATPIVRPRELIGAGALLSGTWKEFQLRFMLIAAIMSVPVVLYFIAGVGVGMLSQLGLFRYSMVAIICQLAGVIFLILATIGIIKQIQSNWTLTVGDTYKVARPYFWPLIWASLLSGLAVIGGTLLLLIPGIMLVIILSFSRVAVVLDEGRGIASLMRSKELVRGVWWGVFMRLIILDVLCLIAVIILSLIPVVGTALSLFTWPFSMIYVVRLYSALKELKGHTALPADKGGKGFLLVALILGFIAVPVLIVSMVWMMMVGMARIQHQRATGAPHTTESVRMPNKEIPA